MKELFKIENSDFQGNTVNTINARDLHQFLEVKTKFNTWIKNRIEKYGFVENKDFVSISKNLEKPDGGRPIIEYYISISMGKELSMVENNDRGRQARLYFIECEEKLKQSLEDLIPKSLPEALEAYANEIREHERTKFLLEAQTQVIEENKPKVTYHDVVLKCPDLLTVTQIANDYPISNQKLNKILAEEDIQYKDKGGAWILKAKYNAQNLAQTETVVFQDSLGNNHAKLHTKWTQKGRLFIYDLLKKRGIVPHVEQPDYVPPPSKELD